MKLKILFEDAHLLVIYKPAGVPVQSARIGTRDCESMLKNYLYEKEPEKGVPYLGVVHRLDQPVEDFWSSHGRRKRLPISAVRPPTGG